MIDSEEEAPLHCPSCETVIMRKYASMDTGMVLDRCVECRGFWFDSGEVRQFLNSRGFQQRFLSPGATETQPPTQETPRDCPQCDKRLYCLEIAGVTVDVCVHCLGVWLDAGELEHLVQAGKEGNLGDCDSLLSHEVQEGLRGEDIPSDTVGHLVRAVRGLLTR